MAGSTPRKAQPLSKTMKSEALVRGRGFLLQSTVHGAGAPVVSTSRATALCLITTPIQTSEWNGVGTAPQHIG